MKKTMASIAAQIAEVDDKLLKTAMERSFRLTREEALEKVAKEGPKKLLYGRFSASLANDDHDTEVEAVITEVQRRIEGNYPFIVTFCDDSNILAMNLYNILEFLPEQEAMSQSQRGSVPVCFRCNREGNRGMVDGSGHWHCFACVGY